jgi:trehalose/maltose hydrolase-like predicted phosphorylase
VRVGGTYGGIVAATRELRGHHVVDDLAALAAGRPNAPAPQVALEKLDGATRAGFDVLLDEQRRAWEARWEDADIVVPADDDLQLAIRFALFHLMSSVPDTGEAAVGARGLTGAGYRGHVFWDADTFVLPFLAATHPASARAMLEYRINRIAAACENARALGRAGARFPWESAATGHDVTPQSAVDRTGHVVPILTGRLEEHIVADVAWAACQYVAWTGDEEFARGPGLTLLVETARYWASRVSIDRGGVAHVYEVIGPDEYHESVDDNAFTNVMARWNLERAAAAVDDDAVGLDHGVEPDEQASWRAVAAALVDGYDPDTRIHEQFAGFFSLEPLIISEVAPRRPIAADILLGADRTHGAQVIKQADVLMLHHLVPEAVPPESLEPDLNFYEPRTAHGSSLSPAVHAALLARLGRTSEALAALDLAARIDLDDLTGSTAAGLHLATMGGLWQALVFGFAGVRPRGGRLMIDPRLPSTWPELKVRVRFHGVRVCIVIHEERVVFDADAPLPIEIGGTSFVVGPGVVTLSRTAAGWELIS